MEKVVIRDEAGRELYTVGEGGQMGGLLFPVQILADGITYQGEITLSLNGISPIGLDNLALTAKKRASMVHNIPEDAITVGPNYVRWEGNPYFGRK